MAQKFPPSPKRVFLNHIDSFSSGNIAEFLCERVIGGPAEDVEPDEEEEESGGSHRAAAFQVVGTVSDGSRENKTRVHEEYRNLDRKELLSKLMRCDVIIYDVTQHTDQLEEATWAVKALHNQTSHVSGPKLFILVSTVMTWARSKPLDPDDPKFQFTDEIFWVRRSHPNFTRHIDLEKLVVKLGKTDRALFSTYVVASGLQYGRGEQIFHHFFKQSWLGREISVFGDGNNIIPTIHIRDLASVVQNLIQHPPKPYYLLAVDSSSNTMVEMVKAVAAELGPGKIQKRPFDEAFLIRDMSVMEVDSMQVDLRMKAVYINQLFSISWLCESGLVKNMKLVVEEYRQTRGLLPLRVCVLGPPAVGKTSMSKQICERYKLHHLTLKDVVSETVAQLEEAVKNPDADPDSVGKAQELLSILKEGVDHDGGVSEEQLKVLQDKLKSNPCRNQGFVLDGFPNTYEQAKDLFYAEEVEEEEEEEEEEEGDGASLSRGVMPEFVLSLDASDSFLTDRVMDLPEWQVQELHYDPERFPRRLAAYREAAAGDDTIISFFTDVDVKPLLLEISSNEEPGCSLLMQKVFDTLGPPRTYSPSSQKVEEEERREAEERMRREAQERAEEEQREEEEARSRAARWEEWTGRLEEARQQEEQQLEDLTMPMRTYLMESVMPTLTLGLMECYRTQPADPVDFLAEFLVKNNPCDGPQ